MILSEDQSIADKYNHDRQTQMILTNTANSPEASEHTLVVNPVASIRLRKRDVAGRPPESLLANLWRAGFGPDGTINPHADPGPPPDMTSPDSQWMPKPSQDPSMEGIWSRDLDPSLSGPQVHGHKIEAIATTFVLFVLVMAIVGVIVGSFRRIKRTRAMEEESKGILMAEEKLIEQKQNDVSLV